MKDLTIEKAYELAVKKWKLVVKHDGNDRDADKEIPEIKKFKNNCPYCQLFVSVDTGCNGCPLRSLGRIYGLGCRQEDHPYDIWLNDQTKANAQAVLDLIIKTKPV